MGIVTPKVIEMVKNKKEIQMKDGSTLYFYTEEEFSNASLKWVVDNPGHQMFTGSFHPINDKLWEDRHNWDIRVAPKEPVTLIDIFERQVIIKLATMRKNASLVMSRFKPYLGQDSVHLILSFVDNSDLASLCSVCKTSSGVSSKQQNSQASSIPLQPTQEYTNLTGNTAVYYL
jgi:hypothetical protein